MIRRNSNDAMSYAIKAMGTARMDKGGNPYVIHLIQTAHITRDIMVASGMDPNDDEVIQAAILHDTVEDTATTLNDLLDYGFSERTVGLVDAVTRRPDEDYLAYLIRLKSNSKEAIVMKAGDCNSNIDFSRLGPHTPTTETFDRGLKYALVNYYLRSETVMESLGALLILSERMFKSDESANHTLGQTLLKVAEMDGVTPESVAGMATLESIGAYTRARDHLLAVVKNRTRGLSLPQKETP